MCLFLTMSQSLLMCRLAAMQLEAVSLNPSRVVAVRKETASDGTISIRTTAPGDVRLITTGALEVSVRWQNPQKKSGKDIWKTSKFSEGTKIVLYNNARNEVRYTHTRGHARDSSLQLHTLFTRSAKVKPSWISSRPATAARAVTPKHCRTKSSTSWTKAWACGRMRSFTPSPRTSFPGCITNFLTVVKLSTKRRKTNSTAACPGNLWVRGVPQPPGGRVGESEVPGPGMRS